MAVSREFGLEGYLLYDRPINSEEFCQIFDLIDRQGIVVDQHLHEELVDDERIQSIIFIGGQWRMVESDLDTDGRFFSGLGDS
jgi:hypothetical protein